MLASALVRKSHFIVKCHVRMGEKSVESAKNGGYIRECLGVINRPWIISSRRSLLSLGLQINLMLFKNIQIRVFNLKGTEFFNNV